MKQGFPKRLIEVDLPIKRISAHARREKSIRHGHISTLHIWWARRPLAACRAVICASLWPDPADPNCPQSFRDEAAKQIVAFAKASQSNKWGAEICDDGSFSRYMRLAHNGGIDPSNVKGQTKLRAFLLDFIADFAAWEASTNHWFLDTARSLTQSAHEALGGEKGTRPLVVDPFAGGGAIPLEALRVGADAFASDLNPVAVLLNKVLLEYIPKHGQKLADEVRRWGRWVKEQAETELAQFYPKDADGSTPIAYLWARTIQCEGPSCGIRIPLVGSFWLSRKRKPQSAIQLSLSDNNVRFDVQTSIKQLTVRAGLTSGNKATCPRCDHVHASDRVKSQLAVKNGGSSDCDLLAVVLTDSTGTGKTFRSPTQGDVSAARAAAEGLKPLSESHIRSGVSLVPDEACPPQGALGFRFQPYGIRRWKDAYTPRQLLSLSTFTKHVSSDTLRSEMEREVPAERANVILTLLSLAVGKMNDRCSSFCRWEPDYLKIQAANGGENKMPMRLDFVESNPFGGKSGDWLGHVEWIAEVVEHVVATAIPVGSGTVLNSAAQHLPLPQDSASALVTDPPYYNAFGYSDLSEFFWVWLKRACPTSVLNVIGAPTEKRLEAIVIGKDLGDGRGEKTATTYLKDMTDALDAARSATKPNGIGVVVFASKATAAWEALLDAQHKAHWTSTGSWPLTTEMEHRTRALGSAALHSSVHLVGRPLEDNDGKVRENVVGDWRDVLAELPTRIREWMARLSNEGVVGADAIFACLGPALEIFSRYSRVEKASGEPVLLKEYLTYVWGAVAQEALAQIFKDADATGFEEDARLTAMWLWTLNAGSSPSQAGDADAVPDDAESEASDDGDGEEEGGDKSKGGGYVLEFDAARKIAQGLGAHLEQLAGVVEVKGDKARLLSVSERTKRLFGKEEADAPTQGKRKKKDKQFKLWSPEDLGEAEAEAGGWGDKSVPKLGDTTLDRIHQSMILFAAGRGEALRRFLAEEGAGQDQRFWKLANALSALYPQGTDEKRWVDGVLARKKGLGL